MSTPYIDPIIKKYKDLIEAANPGLFKGFYQGDPLRIPKSNLPALIISKTRTNLSPMSNAEDAHEIVMTMNIITDMRDEINDDQSVVPGVAQLYDIIEGRDAQYKLKASSILNILRSNIVVDASLNLRTNLASITTADYGLTIGKRGSSAETYATEGSIEFIATYSQIR